MFGKEDVQGRGRGGEISVETVDATINNVLQSNYRAIGWGSETPGRCFGGAKRHASLHSLKPGFEEEAAVAVQRVLDICE